MGTMFFANPVAALRNIRQALVPGGRLAMVVWRSKLENECFYRGQLITERFVIKPDEYDEPTCGPGPFAMANADTTSGIMLSAGFENVALHRCDLPIQVGVDLDEAVQFVMSIGPAGEILRLAETARPICTSRSRPRCARAWPSGSRPTAFTRRRPPGSSPGTSPSQPQRRTGHPGAGAHRLSRFVRSADAMGAQLCDRCARRWRRGGRAV